MLQSKMQTPGMALGVRLHAGLLQARMPGAFSAFVRMVSAISTNSTTPRRICSRAETSSRFPAMPDTGRQVRRRQRAHYRIQEP